VVLCYFYLLFVFGAMVHSSLAIVSSWLSCRSISSGIYFFSIDRLGQEALNYPLNLAALILVGISILLGILHKDKIIIAITLWCLIALLPSRNIQLLDTVSVLISLGIPLAILIGVAISKFCDFIVTSKFSPFIKNIIAPVLVGALGISGIIATLAYPTTLDSYLKASDLKAFEYINEDIPVDAKFID